MTNKHTELIKRLREVMGKLPIGDWSVLNEAIDILSGEDCFDVESWAELYHLQEFVKGHVGFANGKGSADALEALKAKLAALEGQEPIAHLKFWAHQSVSPDGGVEADEGMEVCRTGDIGMDGEQAVAVYLAAGAAQPANAAVPTKPVAWMVDEVNFYLAEQLDRNDQPIPHQVPLYAAPLPPVSAAVPEGWKLVPIEPTVFMQQAALEACRKVPNTFDGQPALPTCYELSASGFVYRAMLADAPQPPAPAKPLPLTDKQIATAWISCADPMAMGGVRADVWKEFARAIEAAHGIKEPT